MSKLKSLQFLSGYVVGKHEENKIKELGALANLHDSIWIDKLEDVVDSSEALEARMFDKNSINSLSLWWSVNKDENTVDSQMESDILDKLRPHTNLKELQIRGYRSTTFPDCISYCEKLGNSEAFMNSQFHGLTHLNIEGGSGESVKCFPKEGMSNLKSLQFLSDYIVGKHEENKIKELGALADLHESISIGKLENVVNSSEALEARMSNKDGIDSITLTWSSNEEENTVDSEMERDILDKLQPHINLKELQIKGYRGTRFPDWLQQETGELCSIQEFAISWAYLSFHSW
ncbi:hypothetical protein AHAS_Ahas02G0259400 [Arachis hypogaea]